MARIARCAIVDAAKVLLIATVTHGTLLVGLALATPVQWTTASGGNGHWYEALRPIHGMNWTTANQFATGITWLGLPGHLATFSTNAEWLFVLPITQRLLWIGLSDDAVEGDYQWVTEEPFVYSAWMAGEGGISESEDFILTGPALTWADHYDLHYVLGYPEGIGFIVEFEPPPLAADVDFDADVDFTDFLVLQAGFGIMSGARKSDGDCDDDGDVDFQDFLVLQADFGTTDTMDTSIGLASVPEPSTLALALCAGLGLILYALRARRRV